jgi:hypothetical protein
VLQLLAKLKLRILQLGLWSIAAMPASSVKPDNTGTVVSTQGT